MRQAVTHEVGELALRRVKVEGRSVREWLNQLDAKARYSAEAVEVSSIRSTQSVIHALSVPDAATTASQRQAAASNRVTAAQLAGQDQAPGVAAAPAGSGTSHPRPPSTTTTTSTTRRRR